MKDICILTESRYLNPKNPNWYIQNIIQEERLISVALSSFNISCGREAWDQDFDIANYKHVLFRTTWNYFDKIDSFKLFLAKGLNIVKFINPYPQIIWNLNKKYLIDISKRGINIPDTVIVTKGSFESLSHICNRKKWKEIVIKPCTSAAAWNTYRIKIEEIENFEALFINILEANDMMVQLFLNNVINRGEISIMMLGGEYSHAVIKTVKSGDFRVQDDFGGKVNKYAPSKNEILFAEQVIQSCDFSPVYARVDIILDNNNQLALSELELIEPEMWFRFHEPAANRLAKAIHAYI